MKHWKRNLILGKLYQSTNWIVPYEESLCFGRFMFFMRQAYNWVADEKGRRNVWVNVLTSGPCSNWNTTKASNRNIPQKNTRDIPGQQPFFLGRKSYGWWLRSSTYFAHVQTCDNVRFPSATQWTASVHTLHVQTCDKARVRNATKGMAWAHVLDTCPKLW